MNKSTLFLTINPNVVEDEEDAQHFKDVVNYLLDKLGNVLLLRQGDMVYGFEELEGHLVGDVQVAVKYEVGPQFHRSHCHIKLEAVLNEKGSMMHVDINKLRGYFKEQLGYSPYVNVKFHQDQVFNIDRYIRK